MSQRYSELVRGLRAAVLGSAGVTDASLRAAVLARAAALGERPGTGQELPPALTPFVDTVAREAYRVTDDDVLALRRAGFSEDAIFEIAASAALGAGVGRLERGLAALRGEI